MNKNLLFALILSLLFFLAGFLTLKDYGISWDEPTHFKRGQSYLWFFETGQLHYKGLVPYNLARAKSDKTYHQRSYYQDDSQDGQFWLDIDGGHPPLNGILAAISNQVFYQKLGWLGDVESYHLFEILVASVLVGVIFLFGQETFGFWAGFSASVLTASYPLLWAESHFNIKDPVETTFFTLTAYFFWKSINQKNPLFLFISSICAGLAFGTKFNILFLPLMILPWFVSLLISERKSILKTILNRKFLTLLFLFPAIMYGIFFISWPFIWHNPLHNTISVFRYYQDIGFGGDFQPGLKNNQWNIYPVKWILFTTPPLTLSLFLIGFFGIKETYKRKSNVLIFWVVWFFITILRVIVPGTTIYGGDRQIMEFIPAMCLIAGVGFEKFRILILTRLSLFKYSWVFFLILVLISLRPLYKLHPNENVYFNLISGGLKKQMGLGFSAAGNSFGNTYLQGLKWVNQNAPKYSKLALIQGTAVNIPAYWIRPDIDYANNSWSGIDREGEYLTEVTYNIEVKVYNYAWEYVERMLTPVYQVTVDGSPILKVWKNDLEHTKPEYRKVEVQYNGAMHILVDKNQLLVDLPEAMTLSRLLVNFKQTNCQKSVGGILEISQDGQNWFKEKDPVGFVQSAQVPAVKDNTLTYFFAAKEAKDIKLVIDNQNSCLLSSPQVGLVVLK